MRNKYNFFFHSKFSNDTSGAVALIFGIAIFAVMGLLGAAVDYSRTLSYRNAMQQAADSAALAGASAIVEEHEDENLKRKQIAREFFDASFSNHADKENLNVNFDAGPDPDNSDGYKVTVSATVPTYILGVIGKTEFNPAVSSIVAKTDAIQGEVVMVLDLSSSMEENSKVHELKEAAEKLVDILTDNGNTTGIKIGMVPFAGFVYGDLPQEYALDPSEYKYGKICFSSPKNPANVEHVTPVSDDTKFGIRDGQVRREDDEPYKECKDYRSKNLNIVRLTDDFDKIKFDINRWQPKGGTNLSTSMLVGWHLISPEAPFTEGASYGSGTKKTIIFMTDGTPSIQDYDENGWIEVEGEESEWQNALNLSKICERIKASGIKVYTIFFDKEHADAEDILEGCATDSTHFFNTSVGNLEETFKAIATRASKDLRITH